MTTVRIFALALGLVSLPSASQAGKTHMLQKAESLVVLTGISAPGNDQCGGYWSNKVLAEVRPDGTTASAEFVVPAGFVLVVTEVDWTVDAGANGYTAGKVAMFLLTLGSDNAVPVFQAPTLIDADVAAAGITAGSVSLTTGFRVQAGVPICPRAYAINSFGGSSHIVESLTLRGYLVKAK